MSTHRASLYSEESMKVLSRDMQPDLESVPPTPSVPPVRTIVLDRAPEPVRPPEQREAVRRALAG